MSNNNNSGGEAAAMRTVEDTDIHKAVRAAYANRVLQASSGQKCCGGGGDGATTSRSRSQPDAAAPCGSSSPCCAAPPLSGTDAAAQKMGYSAADVASVPEDSNLGLGCGAPLEAAGVKRGDCVLDLGSGAGFDAFLAAQRVGPTGRVLGVDMTPEMVAQARKNAEKRRARAQKQEELDQMPVVEFREGKIEALPVESESVDVVISNCVINLSPDKAACFREAFRVLKPGGRMAVSDIALTQALPSSVAQNLAVYIGCIAGASLLPDYLDAVKAAGFTRVEVSTKRAFDVLSCDDPVVRAAVDGAKEEGVDLEAVKNSVVSATVVAHKE